VVTEVVGLGEIGVIGVEKLVVADGVKGIGMFIILELRCADRVL
jgi:hypothetical protein